MTKRIEEKKLRSDRLAPLDASQGNSFSVMVKVIVHCLETKGKRDKMQRVSIFFCAENFHPDPFG